MSSISQRTPGCLLACALGLVGCKLYEHDDEADAAIATPCIETVEPLGVHADNPLDVSASRLLALVQGAHTATLTWVEGGGGQTLVTVTVTGASARYVRSRINPQAPVWQRPGCADRVEVRGQLALSTRSGELAESISHMQLAAYQDDEAHGTFALRVDELRGTYRPVPRATLCLVRVDLSVLFTRVGVHGSLTDVWRDCGGHDPEEKRFARAHWGSRWQNY